MSRYTGPRLRLMRALGTPLPAGVVLIQLLERRLDNIIFRAGFARTIPGGRQMVTHGHVTVNGRAVDRASFRVRRGDVVGLRSAGRAIAERALQTSAGLESPWLLIDKPALTVTIASYPDDTFLPFELQPRLIIEHYSRAM